MPQQPFKRFIISFSFFSSLSLALFLTSTNAKVPNPLEPDYAEAIIAYQGKDYDLALTLLDNLLKQEPEQVEFLRMKALILKFQKKPKQSIRSYIQLIRSQKKRGAPKKELAPYYFEIGMQYFLQKKVKTAEKHLQTALQLEFNVTITRFYLGLICFQQSRWADAQTYFLGVVRSKNQDLKPPAHLFLAQIYLKTLYTSGAIHQFLEAKRISSAILNDPTAPENSRKVAQQTLDTAQQALQPLDRRTFFGSLATLSAYDSNIQTIPVSTDESTATGKKSAKQTIQYNMGLATSPLKKLQFTPTYRGSVNFNFNRDSREQEYFNQTLALTTTHRPTSPTHFGIRLNTSPTFQNKLKSDDQYRFTLISWETGIGPFLRTEINPQMRLSFELSPSYTRFLTDASQSNSNLHRSGMSYRGTALWQWNRGHAFLNPSALFFGEFTDTTGIEYENISYGLELRNTFLIRDRLNIGSRFQAEFASYDKQLTSQRADSTIDLGVSASYQVVKKVILLSQINYTLNFSNEPAAYEYRRLIFSLGLNYAI